MPEDFFFFLFFFFLSDGVHLHLHLAALVLFPLPPISSSCLGRPLNSTKRRWQMADPIVPCAPTCFRVCVTRCRGCPSCFSPAAFCLMACRPCRDGDGSVK